MERIITKKEKIEREQQRKFYQECLQKSIENKNIEDIRHYTKQLKFMDMVDFYNENFN